MASTLTPGESPRTLFCSMCGAKVVPDYDGWWAMSVCGQACMDERQYRYALQILKQPYKVKGA